MFGKIARGVTARPWLVIISWLIVAAAVLASSPSISSVTNSDQSAFLPAQAESVRAAALARHAFPGEEGANAVIVVKRVDGAALTNADRTRLAELARGLNTTLPSAVRGVQFDPR